MGQLVDRSVNGVGGVDVSSIWSYGHLHLQVMTEKKEGKAGARTVGEQK